MGRPDASSQPLQRPQPSHCSGPRGHHVCCPARSAVPPPQTLTCWAGGRETYLDIVPVTQHCSPAKHRRNAKGQGGDLGVGAGEAPEPGGAAPATCRRLRSTEQIHSPLEGSQGKKSRATKPGLQLRKPKERLVIHPGQTCFRETDRIRRQEPHWAPGRASARAGRTNRVSTDSPATGTRAGPGNMECRTILQTLTELFCTPRQKP